MNRLRERKLFHLISQPKFNSSIQENGFFGKKPEKQNMACTHNLGFLDLPSIYNLTFPVGPNKPNVRDDVLLVQTLMKLANFTRNNGGPVEASSTIKIDGWFGDQTKRMIEAFELHIREKHLPLIADGVFEPSSNDGYSAKGFVFKIIHLNRFAMQATRFGNEYNRIPTDPETHPILRQSLLTRRQAVLCD
jgi:hypothetical protein